MKTNVRMQKESDKTLYNYYAAKKLFFTRTPDKYLLVEKKLCFSEVKPVSLRKRNIAISNKKNGVVVYSEKKVNSKGI